MALPEHALDHYTDITTSADDLIAQGWHGLQGAALVQVSGTYTADEIVEKINALGGIIVDKKKVHSRMNRALNIVSEGNEVSRAEVQAALDRMRIDTGCQERMNGIKGNSKGKRVVTREQSIGSAVTSEAAASSAVANTDKIGTTAALDTATSKTTAKKRADTPPPSRSAGKRKRRESASTNTSRSATSAAGRQGQGERVVGQVQHTAKARVNTPMLDKALPRLRARGAAYAVSFRSTAVNSEEAQAEDAALRRRVGEGLGRQPESIELEVGLDADGAAALLIQLYRDDSMLMQ